MCCTRMQQRTGVLAATPGQRRSVEHAATYGRVSSYSQRRSVDRPFKISFDLGLSPTAALGLSLVLSCVIAPATSLTINRYYMYCYFDVICSVRYCFALTTYLLYPKLFCGSHSGGCNVCTCTWSTTLASTDSGLTTPTTKDSSKMLFRQK